MGVVTLSEYILDVTGIVKTFPGVRALNGVALKVKAGEVHAVVGENGAGKSTLMLVLGGVHRPDAGDIVLDGKHVVFHDARDANDKGISIVYQELSLVQNLSVADNVYANRQPITALGLVNKSLLNKRTQELLTRFGMDDVSPDDLVKNLSIAKQQMVEILKAVSFNPKVLILDEPTSSLTELEIKQLFSNIEMLKQTGMAIIYISHHLNEVFQIADRVTVLRDGEFVCDEEVSTIDEDFLVTKMVGRTLTNVYGVHDPDQAFGDVVLDVQDLTKASAFKDVSFHVSAGEIVGFAGLVGAGRTEVGRAIFGADPFDSGSVTLNGQPIRMSSTSQGIAHGIGYVTEDRKTQGLYLNFTLQDNLSANRLKDFSRFGFLSAGGLRQNAEDSIQDFHIIASSDQQKLMNLSGGNQQKVLLAMWFGIRPKLLIVDEPTRGVDVGAKSEIYTLLRKLATAGVAIMMISSDLQEILGMSDRIVVMKEGRVAGELSHAEASEDSVLSLAIGSTE